MPMAILRGISGVGKHCLGRVLQSHDLWHQGLQSRRSSPDLMDREFYMPAMMAQRCSIAHGTVVGTGVRGHRPDRESHNGRESFLGEDAPQGIQRPREVANAGESGCLHGTR